MTTAPAGAGFGLAVRSVLDPVLCAVFPGRCPACRGALDAPSRGPLCARCWHGLPRHRGEACPCGQALPAGVAPPCGRCRRGLSAIALGASLGPYEGALRVLVHELKYRSRRRVAGRLAEELRRAPGAAALLSADALLVPVPLHASRQRARGYNQAELLARELARRCGLVLVADALVRLRDTPPQAGLSAAARRRNVAGAFGVHRRAVVAGRPVVLVDDVVTTGATAIACARALRAAGAREVRLLSLARVAAPLSREVA